MSPITTRRTKGGFIDYYTDDNEAIAEDETEGVVAFDHEAKPSL